ncbi:hypothetical protein yc1106_02796 [Curvularia clavata]|uniref:Uncharacterized protein n=1 Tax=Curvularia clavata TaxID=95742 RepID=A0A9Q8Z3F5_CURCL|nr:hypothetical protein yc1106_02796 [Curvularia clavata]
MSSREDDDWLMVEAPPVVEPNVQSESDELEEEDEHDEDDKRSDSSAAFEPVPSQSVPQSAEPVAPVTSKQLAAGDGDSDFRGHLTPDQRREIRSKFVGDIHIFFDTDVEKMRAKGISLPQTFYRTFYENSATLSRYVTVDTHVKYRERKDLRIDDGNAFQSVGYFSIDPCMLLEAIERHLVWNQTRIPTAYISVFDEKKYAEQRASFHYKKAKRVGQRVCVAGIHTQGLVPATIRGTCSFTVIVFTKISGGESQKLKQYTQRVDIPVWIHEKAKIEYGSIITPKQLEKSGADMWMAIKELRFSNLKGAGPRASRTADVICADGHTFEWLCCGAIPESRITGVWPYVKDRLYSTDPGVPIQSCENSGQPWHFNWKNKRWEPGVLLAPPPTTATTEPSPKRRRVDDGGSREAAPCERCDNRPVLSMSMIQSIVDIEPLSCT